MNKLNIPNFVNKILTKLQINRNKTEHLHSLQLTSVELLEFKVVTIWYLHRKQIRRQESLQTFTAARIDDRLLVLYSS